MTHRAIFALALSAWTLSASADDCPVKFSFDTSHAALLIGILADGRLTETEAGSFLDHPVTADVIRKTRSYGLDVDRDSLAAQIGQLAANKEPANNYFGLERYNSRKLATADLVHRLEADFPLIHESICERLRPYTPPNREFRQSIVVLSAVNSSGFTFGDPDRIFLVAEAFDGDLWGFADLIVHESYHSIQNELMSQNPLYSEKPGLSPTGSSSIRILAGTITEGTATHIADPIEAGNEGAMRAFQYRLAQRYRRDINHQFALFDTTLFRAYKDPEVDYYTLHKIGLEGNEAFYHVGALMTRTIAQADGPQAIPGYFRRSPVDFFSRYVALANADKGLPQFSASTRAILEALTQSVAR